MALRDEARKLGLAYHGNLGTLGTNADILDIYEGNLLPHVLLDMSQQLSPRAFSQAKFRVPAINLEKRLVDKLSTIYTTPPERTVTGTQAEQVGWQWYLDNFAINTTMQSANEYFNMHRGCALEPYLDAAKMPRLRAIPRDRFFVMALDPADPLRVTHFIKVMGKQYIREAGDKEAQERVVLWVYTDTEFLIIDDEGEILDSEMQRLGQDGRNPVGRIPFVYLNKSKTRAFPSADVDLLSMTKLVPTMLADVNYALMFQAFSLIYTIDVDDQKLELNPNTIVSLKSDPTSNKDPKLGTIKPEVDSDKAMASIKEQLSLWLQSRGIRPGAIDNSTELSVSGMSKMVDEMDTTAERKKTVPYFVDAEVDLFNLVVFHMHPLWVRDPAFELKMGFSSSVSYSVQFGDQIVVKSRQELITEVKTERELQMVSRRTAMQRINPEWTEEEIDEEIARIDSENEVEIEPENEVQSGPEMEESDAEEEETEEDEA